MSKEEKIDSEIKKLTQLTKEVSIIEDYIKNPYNESFLEQITRFKKIEGVANLGEISHSILNADFSDVDDKTKKEYLNERINIIRAELSKESEAKSFEIDEKLSENPEIIKRIYGNPRKISPLLFDRAQKTVGEYLASKFRDDIEKYAELTDPKDKLKSLDSLVNKVSHEFELYTGKKIEPENKRNLKLQIINLDGKKNFLKKILSAVKDFFKSLFSKAGEKAPIDKERTVSEKKEKIQKTILRGM